MQRLWDDHAYLLACNQERDALRVVDVRLSRGGIRRATTKRTKIIQSALATISEHTQGRASSSHRPAARRVALAAVCGATDSRDCALVDDDLRSDFLGRLRPLSDAILKALQRRRRRQRCFVRGGSPLGGFSVGDDDGSWTENVMRHVEEECVPGIPHRCRLPALLMKIQMHLNNTCTSYNQTDQSSAMRASCKLIIHDAYLNN